MLAKETKMFYKIRIKKREFKRGIYKKDSVAFITVNTSKHRGFLLKYFSSVDAVKLAKKKCGQSFVYTKQ